jgi:hypothetical protein
MSITPEEIRKLNPEPPQPRVTIKTVDGTYYERAETPQAFAELYELAGGEGGHGCVKVRYAGQEVWLAVRQIVAWWDNPREAGGE